MNRKIKIILQSFVSLALALVVLSGCGKLSSVASTEVYHHLVILGDPHLPGRDLENKKQVLKEINSWDDVESVIAVGDICEVFGTDAEYAQATDFFSTLHKPLFPIAGNHDYFYRSPSGPERELVAGSQASQQEKLRKFRETFGLKNYYYSTKVGGYTLIFLSADHDRYLSGMSAQEITWFRAELAKKPQQPTIIIFHGPLAGTLRTYKPFINTPDFIAQPVETIHEILVSHPQVFLWVSGHTHTSPLEESYASPVNVYAGQVTNIHNKDMNRGVIWTNSLFLYPDKVVIKTFDHHEEKWCPELERVIMLPKLSGAQ